ncbi:amidase [Marinobacteraceae bacterium S3BR75-40.1]
MTELVYRSARSLARDLAEGTITSQNLVQAYLDRIQARNEPINAVVTLATEKALEEARRADTEREAGNIRGPLHGLPMTIKDTWEVAEMHTTAGAPALQDHVSALHADVVDRLTDAGAIIIGKTNVPLYASDIQTYNKVYGTTRNPHNPQRTPGGSSGGAAAALAAGLTPLEVGSDIGGSIRIPAHFNGVFGHKPTRDLVSLRGHIPGEPGTQTQADMVEGGPLARSADDLAFLLEIIAGPRPIESRYWKLSLQPCPHDALNRFRVGTWLEDSLCPIDRELYEAYQLLTRSLTDQGALVSRAKHQLLDLRVLLPRYFATLGALIGLGFPQRERTQMRFLSWLLPLVKPFIKLTFGAEAFASGVNTSFRHYAVLYEIREKMRVELETLFEEFDVLLTPITPTTAVPHDHKMPLFNRRITVNGQARPYMDQFCWIALATLLGLPATSVPLGKDRNGLPCSIQVIGAPGKDLTTIKFAQLLEEAGLAGFQKPEGY